MRYFMSETKIILVVNDHQYETARVKMEVPQRSPVYLILFIIYLNAIFSEIEKKVELCIAMSFADDCG